MIGNPFPCFPLEKYRTPPFPENKNGQLPE
jgi:hypothetical protein